MSSGLSRGEGEKKAISAWYAYENEINGPLILSAHLRRHAQEAQKFFEESKTGILLSDPLGTPGKEYVAVFRKDCVRILGECEGMV